jgi:hypothetical protein
LPLFPAIDNNCVEEVKNIFARLESFQILEERGFKRVFLDVKRTAFGTAMIIAIFGFLAPG